MKFTEELLNEIKKYEGKRHFERIYNKIKECKNICIWGTGIAGKLVYEKLKADNVEVALFLDNDKKMWGRKIDGISIGHINDIPSKAFVIIAANVRYKIHEQLEKANYDNYIYIDPTFFSMWHSDDKVIDSIRENQHKIDAVYNMLEDDVSKKVFRNVLLHRAVHDISLIWDVYDENQYFVNDVVPCAKGCFIDCGAFQGDTLSSFLKQVDGETYEYIAFEADYNNHQLLNKYCEDNNIENVLTYNLGVWDEKTSLFFQENASAVAGKVLESEENGVKIQVDSLDNVLNEKKIDFIKMDIEGAEIKALKGAGNTIKKSKPVLAISAYHELEHLWEVPLLIKELNADYKIYYRHHMWNMCDTVCYGIDKK